MCIQQQAQNAALSSFFRDDKNSSARTLCVMCLCVRVVLFDTRKSYFEVLDSFPFFQKKRLDWVLKNSETLNSRRTKITVFNTKRNPRVMMSCVFAFAYFARSESIRERDSKKKKEGERRSPHTHAQKSNAERRELSVRVLIVFFVENSQQNTFPQFI